MVDLTYHLSPTPIAHTRRLVNRFSDGALRIPQPHRKAARTDPRRATAACRSSFAESSDFSFPLEGFSTWRPKRLAIPKETKPRPKRRGFLLDEGAADITKRSVEGTPVPARRGFRIMQSVFSPAARPPTARLSAGF
jgi:hypothetical protein